MAKVITYQINREMNQQKAHEIMSDVSQYVLRGWHRSKMPRSKYIGKEYPLDEKMLNEIQERLKSAKRKFFTLKVETYIGNTPQERAQKIKDLQNGLKCRGRKPNQNKDARPVNVTKYLCSINEKGNAQILALMPKA